MRIAVIGGGLAGLAAAALLAAEGALVTIFERRPSLGGMADTEDRDGFLWNWGAHALYRNGAGASVLRRLGIRPQGAVIKPDGQMQVVRDGALHPAPFTARAALTSPLLDSADKLALAKGLAALHAADPRATNFARWADRPIGDWLEAHIPRPRAAQILHALVRLTTFANHPGRQAADAAVTQLNIARSAVWYLHGGWRPLVDALRAAALAAGARIHTTARVSGIDHDGQIPGQVCGVVFADGSRVAVDAAVIATGGPRTVVELLDGAARQRSEGWVRDATPVRAATWELSLRAKPPGSVWVKGLDTPVYVNVHSHYARVAPQGAAMVHVVRYLGPEDPAGHHRQEMEAVLDLALPGWRSQVVDERFLPALTVAHDLPAAGKGLSGRPGAAVPGVSGLAIAGDWVGPRGILADASLASASDAAALVSHSLQESMV